MPPTSLLNINLSSSVNTPLDVIFNQESVKFGLWEPWFGLWMVNSKLFVLNIVICFGGHVGTYCPNMVISKFSSWYGNLGSFILYYIIFIYGFWKWSPGCEKFLKGKKRFSLKNIAKFKKYTNSFKFRIEKFPKIPNFFGWKHKKYCEKKSLLCS
jgi:hypothetical protein